MTGRCFADTNLLIYMVDRAEPEKGEAARRVWEAEAGSGNLVLSTQVLQEFYAVVTRKGKPPMRPEQAEEYALHFAREPVVPSDALLVLSAIRRSRADGLAIWDCLIIEAALAAGCTRLLTEDFQHGRRFGDLVVENPFAAVG